MFDEARTPQGHLIEDTEFQFHYRKRCAATHEKSTYPEAATLIWEHSRPPKRQLWLGGTIVASSPRVWARLWPRLEIVGNTQILDLGL